MEGVLRGFTQVIFSEIKIVEHIENVKKIGKYVRKQNIVGII